MVRKTLKKKHDKRKKSFREKIRPHTKKIVKTAVATAAVAAGVGATYYLSKKKPADRLKIVKGVVSPGYDDASTPDVVKLPVCRAIASEAPKKKESEAGATGGTNCSMIGTSKKVKKTQSARIK